MMTPMKDNNDSMNTSTSPSSLCDTAREAARVREEKAKAESLQKQTEHIKNLVGEEMFSQCVYHADRDQWEICDMMFTCYMEGTMYAYGQTTDSTRLCVIWWNSYRWIDTLEDLGKVLLERDREAKAKADREAAYAQPETVRVVPSRVNRPWWSRWLFP